MHRLKFVTSKSLRRPEMDYLYAWHQQYKNFIFEFLIRSSITDTNIVEGTPLYADWTKDFDIVSDLNFVRKNGNSKSFTKFEYENWNPDFIDDNRNEIYYVYHDNDNLILYKEIPLLMNDDTFTWRDNSKYNSKEAVITRGAFEFQCIVNADGNGKVIVRYIKCENFHRTRVTIAEFDVDDAYNETFIEAIDKWSREFKDSLVA